MTIKGSEHITMLDTLGHKVDGRCKKVYCVETGKWWSSAIECARELKVTPYWIRQCCNDDNKTCKGLHFCYEEHVTRLVSKLAANLSERYNALAEQEKELEEYRAWKKAQEAERKAKEKAAEDLAKAEATYELRKRLYDRKMEEGRKAYVRMMEAKNKMDALRAQQQGK